MSECRCPNCGRFFFDKDKEYFRSRVEELNKENTRLREMVDASTGALERIYKISVDWKPIPDSYCVGGEPTMQPWDKSESEQPEVSHE